MQGKEKMNKYREPLEYGLFIGNLHEFCTWWNKQPADGARIVHIKEITVQPDPVCVEYILQNRRNYE